MSHHNTKLKQNSIASASADVEHRHKPVKFNKEHEISIETEMARVVTALTLLKNISNQRYDKSSLVTIETLQTTIEKLEERIKHNQLSLAAIHKTMHEVRLEALLLSTQIKVQAMYDHQILIAPRQEWRKQIKADHPDLNDWYDLKKDTPLTINEILQKQLNILAQVSDLLFNFDGV